MNFNRFDFHIVDGLLVELKILLLLDQNLRFHLQVLGLLLILSNLAEQLPIGLLLIQILVDQSLGIADPSRRLDLLESDLHHLELLHLLIDLIPQHLTDKGMSHINLQPLLLVLVHVLHGPLGDLLDLVLSGHVRLHALRFLVDHLLQVHQVQLSFGVFLVQLLSELLVDFDCSVSRLSNCSPFLFENVQLLFQINQLFLEVVLLLVIENLIRFVSGLYVIQHFLIRPCLIQQQLHVLEPVIEPFNFFGATLLVARKLVFVDLVFLNILLESTDGLVFLETLLFNLVVFLSDPSEVLVGSYIHDIIGDGGLLSKFFEIVSREILNLIIPAINKKGT